MSATWQFRSPRNSGPVEWSWDPHLDVNGDGIDDLGVSIWPLTPSEVGTVILGGPTPNPRVGATTADVTSAPTLVSAGDVNGDGYSDVAVAISIPGTSPFTFTYGTELHLGGPGGFRSAPDQELDTADPILFGSVACHGDFDGDGFSDVVAEARTGLILLRGGVSGWALPPRAVPGITGQVLAAADLDADGLDDLLIAAEGSAPGTTAIEYLHGSPTGFESPRIVTTTTRTVQPRGNGNEVVGDATGDGRLDAVVGLLSTTVTDNALLLITGSPTGVNAVPPLAIGAEMVVGSPGDVNGDGLADEALYVPGSGNGLTVSFASPTGFDLSRGISQWPRTGDGVGFGAVVRNIGDFTGDGLSDVAISQPEGAGSTITGRVFVFAGDASGGVSATPTVFSGSGADARFGDFLAAGRAFEKQLCRSTRGV